MSGKLERRRQIHDVHQDEIQTPDVMRRLYLLGVARSTKAKVSTTLADFQKV